jgi:hypothetical protein
MAYTFACLGVRQIAQSARPPAVREKSADLKFVSEDRATPEYLATFVQSEIVKWAAPIKASGVSVD